MYEVLNVYNNKITTKAYYDFFKMGYINSYDGEHITDYTDRWNINEFHINDFFSSWDSDSSHFYYINIFAPIKVLSEEIGNDIYIYFSVEFPTESSVPPVYGLIKRKDFDKIKSLYDNRNIEILQAQKNINNFIDSDISSLANNVLNVFDKDVMLNFRIISILSFKYSCNAYCYDTDKYMSKYWIFKTTYTKKGKEKKQIQTFNANLAESVYKIDKIFNNFADIIKNKKNVEPYVARAIAYESLQKSVINYYGHQWQEKYEPFLDINYEEIKMHADNNSIFLSEYIKNVIKCNKIDHEKAKEILFYFFIMKNNLSGINFYEYFIDFYEIFNKIQNEVTDNMIQHKILTTVERKPEKYTIDDVDLMTGTEFEEFIELMFSKMGYTSYVTKKTGDQGIDVIALRDDIKIGIQTKCYSGSVANSAIQEAVAGKSFYNCKKIMVITNSTFTNSAIELAQSNDVVLWNREMLKEKIKELF